MRGLLYITYWVDFSLEKLLIPNSVAVIIEL